MSRWRRKALELFPERAPDIRRVENVTLLLVDLNAELRHAYAKVPPDRNLIDRVFAFAMWCFKPMQNPYLRNAVAVAFFEHVPYNGAEARRDLVEHLTQRELAELEPLFKQMLEVPVYDALHIEIDRAQSRPVGRRASAT